MSPEARPLYLGTLPFRDSTRRTRPLRIGPTEDFARPVEIGKLAEGTGVNLETVRYYERIGIMPRPARTRGGHRSYEPEHIKWLNFIRRGRELGFTLREVRELLHLVDGRRYTCAQIKKIAVRHIADIRQKRA